MRNRSIIVILAAAIISCAGNDPRYKDTTMLELPPNMLSAHMSEGQKQDEDSGNEDPEAVKSGLGDKVYMTHTELPSVRLKQNFDEAWVTLDRSLAQLELEVPDRNREEKVYYVKFDADDYRPEDAGLLSTIASSFNNDFTEETYILRVEPQNSETAITAELAAKAEQIVDESVQLNESRVVSDGSANLLKKLYKTLRDDLKPE